MKFLLLLFIPFSLFGQQKEDNNIVQGSDLLMTRKSSTSSAIDGSPYKTDNFVEASINGTTTTALIRYNAYLDEIEFKQKDKILIADKVLGQRFFLTEPSQTYVLVNYTDVEGKGVYGYLVELISHPSGYSLYRKETVKKIDALIGLNSYQANKNSYYELQDDLYIIQYRGDYYTLPKTLKKFSEPYRALAKEYLKGKWKVNEFELKNFVNFLNSNLR